MIRSVFKQVKNIELGEIPRLTYEDAIRRFGSDKPDMRFGMELIDMDTVTKGNGFGVFDNADSVVAINVSGGNTYTRKQLDELTDWVKRPQIGAMGLIYCRINEDGSFKSSVDKFFSQEQLAQWSLVCESKPNDLILLLSGQKDKVRKQMNELRLFVGEKEGLRPKTKFKACWIS